MLMSLPVRSDRVFSPVTQMMLYVTEECNLRCSYCFVNKQPRHMTLATAKKAVDFFLRPEVSGQERLSLNFFGGEPLLRTELLLELLPYLQQRAANRMLLGVTSNGTLAGENVKRFLQESQAHLLVSLDGDKASHEHRATVSGRNSWSHLQRNLAKLVAWAQSTTVRMTYHPGSLNLLDKVLAAQEIGANWILLAPVVEADWQGHEPYLQEQSQRLADWFIQQFIAGHNPPIEHYWTWLAEYHRCRGQAVRPAKACPLGTSLIAVDTAGNILPCHRYLYRKSERFGHVDRTVSLPDKRWDYVHLSRAEIPDCLSCIARQLCGGGCRVVALEAGFGLQGVHPHHCLLTREQMNQVVRIYQQLRDHPRFLPTLLSHQQMPLMFQEAQSIKEVT